MWYEIGLLRAGEDKPTYFLHWFGRSYDSDSIPVCVSLCFCFCFCGVGYVASSWILRHSSTVSVVANGCLRLLQSDLYNTCNTRLPCHKFKAVVEFNKTVI